jgi:heat shock protein HslJ
MREIVKVSLLLAGLAFMSGCGENGSVRGGVMSSSNQQAMGSLSGEEDLGEILSQKPWKSIEIDLEKFRYTNDSNMKTYGIDMEFSDKKVSGIANCQNFSANYKVRNDELSFSKVHFESTDLASCKDIAYADEAVNSFFSSTYTLAGASSSKVVLESTDIETTITLR